MKPVVQLETTGCAIASAAAIAGISYSKARAIASTIGIHTTDSSLWSEAKQIRRLLRHLGFRTSAKPYHFRVWSQLPDLALLSIKWHLERGRPYWHWVVFIREGNEACVLDSKAALRNHRRTDFGRMRPKWYIVVSNATAPG